MRIYEISSSKTDHFLAAFEKSSEASDGFRMEGRVVGYAVWSQYDQKARQKNIDINT